VWKLGWSIPLDKVPTGCCTGRSFVALTDGWSVGHSGADGGRTVGHGFVGVVVDVRWDGKKVSLLVEMKMIMLIPLLLGSGGVYIKAEEGKILKNARLS